MRLLFVVAVVFLTAAMTMTAWGQVKFEENFNYTVGDSLNVLHGWSAHSGTGTNPEKVTSGGLSYTDYASTAIGNAASLATSGEDINKTWATYPSGAAAGGGSLYYSLMARLDSAQNTGDYFFHLLKNSSTFTARIYAKRAANGNIRFGINKSSTGTLVNYSDSIYTFGSTFLLVVKYTPIAGATNDTLALWVNPTLGTTEPAPTVLESAGDKATADVDTVYGVAIRQGSATAAPKGAIDGIRVGTNWEDVTGPLAAPTTITGVASGVTPTAASLAGTVNPNNASTTVAFNYGTTIFYGSSATATQSPLTAGGTVQAVSTTLSGLTQNQVYHFQATATNSQGTTTGSDSTFITVPDAPVATAATTISETGFTANWAAGAGNPAASYTLDVALDAGFTILWTGYPLSGITATTHAVTGLTSGTTYYYRVRANDAGGTSANSNSITAVTVAGPPTATAPTGISSASFNANWTAPSGVITDYRLDVATDIGFGSPVFGYSDKTVAGTTDAVTGLSAAVKYYYRVRAVNPGGTSANSNIDSAVTTATPNVSSPTVTSITSTTATLGATVVSDQGDPDTERGIVWSLGPNPTTADNKIIQGGTGPGTFTVSATGFSAATHIFFRGYAINGNGTGYSVVDSFYTLATEPSSHAGSFAATATSSSTIDLSWTAATGANGYIILQKVGSDPTGLPSEGTGYIVGNTIGDATVAAVVTSGATVAATVSGLAGSTTYHYSIMPYAWDGSHAATYAYKTDPTVPTANATTLSASSDIIANGSFTYSTNIPYITYTGVSDITTSNSVEAFGITIRDGGGAADVDASPTTLTSISFSLTNAGFLSRAALYDGTTELSEVPVSGSTVTFTGLNVVAADGGTYDLTVRVAFSNTVTDKAQFSLTVSAATASSSGSTFAAANAGGATSSVAGDNNRVDVTGTEMRFVGTIPTTAVNTNFTATARSSDVNGNTDIDFTGVVTFAKNSGPGTLSGTTAPNAVAGIATTSNLQFNAGGTYTLSASATGHTPGTSTAFTIVSPAVFKVAGPMNTPGANGPRSTNAVDTLDWESPATWVVVSGGSALGYPHGTDQVILDNTFKAGSYVVKVGAVHNDTVKQITIGYPGNTNEITLFVPKTSVSLALTFGDNAPGNYDMDIEQGGVAYTQNGRFNILGFAALGDSLVIRSGGKFIHNTTSSISGVMIGLSKDINQNGGTFEIRLPKTAVSPFNLTTAGFVGPNVILSADSVGTFQQSTSTAAAFGSFFCTGNLTIGPGVTFNTGVAGSYEGDFFLKGNLTNNGSMNFGGTNRLCMVGTTPQTISGNPILLGGTGFFISNPAGVTLATNLTVTGGTVQTGGLVQALTPEFPSILINYSGTGTVNTGSSSFILNPNGSMDESTNPVEGNVTATRTASQNVNQTFGAIGLEINAAGGAPGSTVVTRKTGVASSGNGHNSILRYFDVAPTNNTALNATMKFSYQTSELNGNLESDLLLHKSTDAGATWSGKSGTVNTGLHNIVATGVNNFSRWTAAAASAPLFVTHTITVRKLQDNDGNILTTGDQTLKKWRLYLYRDSVSAGSLINTQNLNSGIMATLNLEAGTYIAVEEDSTGWLHLGKVHNGTTIVGGDRYDTVTVSGGVGATIDFINQQVSSLTVRKFRDTDGNPATIESPMNWGLSIYQNSVAPANLIASNNTNELAVASIQAGTYIVVEADSGPSWVRINGNLMRSDTLVIPAATNAIDTFINFRPNSIVVRKFEDNDGNFGTSGDRALKGWYLEVKSGATVVASGSSGTLNVGNLGDGTYTVNEADSAGWIHLGQVIDGVPVAGNTNMYSATVADGQLTTVDFVNAPPIYGTLFRSFRADSLALDKDNAGKINKFVKRKADKVFYKFQLKSPVFSPPNLMALTLKFSMSVSALVTRGTVTPETLANYLGGTKLVVTGAVIDTGTTITVEGVGNKGKPVKITYSWSSLPKATKGTVLTYILNQPKNPMPNRVNALAETYQFGGFGTNGLLVGRDRKTPVDSSKFYGWLESPKYTDVLKTLIVPKTLQMQTGSPDGFTTFITNGKPVVKLQKSLPPTKFNNVLLANMIALKLNIAASQLGKIPPGFGELVLNDSAVYTPFTNVLNGKSVSEIAAYGDSLMMGFYNLTSHQFAEDSVFYTLNRAIDRINTAFEGPLDTAYFQDSLVFKGTRSLLSVGYLIADPNIAPTRIKPTATTFVEAPVNYQLYQNYPNPFNPTTTISFDLPEPAVVTLKIYNILGQEVVTLVDHVALDDGTQEFTFNAGNLSSGVYFYRLLANGYDDDGNATRSFTNIKKMLLVK